MMNRSVLQVLPLLAAFAGIPVTYAAAQIEVLPNARPDPPVIDRRTYPQDNCRGNARPRTLSVSCTQVAETTAGAETEFSAALLAKYGISQAELKARILNKIGRKVGGQLREQDTISFSTPRGKNWNHQYDLVVRYQSGYVRIRRQLLGVTYNEDTVPFRYCVSAKYEERGIQELRCPTAFLGFPSVQLVSLRPSGNPCIKGWKYFDLHISVNNFGDKLADGYDIFADVRSRSASYRATFAQGAYIPIGKTNNYQARLAVQCASMPPGTIVSIKVIASKKGSPPDFNRTIEARLPY